MGVKNPKPPGQTRRRNLDNPKWTKLSAQDASAVVPGFPGRRPPASALEYWTAIWTSPVAAMYLPTDVPGLARVCRLHAKAERDDASGQELSELRQGEERYGLSPLARRRLQWEVDRAAGPGTAHDQQAVDDLQRRRDERRTRMEETGS